MKKIFIILCLFIISLSYVHATICSDLEFENSICSDEGEFTFRMYNPTTTTVNNNEIIINTTSPSGIPFELNGVWSNYNKYDMDTSTQKMYKVFTTSKAVIKEKGQYDIVATYFYKNLANKLEICSKTIELECPGYLYDCSISNLSIKNCYTKGDSFYFTYYGLNKGQTEIFSPRKDVIYEFAGPNFKGVGNIDNSKLNIQEDGAYTYTVKYTPDNNKNITSVSMYVSKCGSQTKVQLKNCKAMAPCNSNNDCQSNQVCSNKQCVNLNCNGCQEAKDHQCVNSCEDNNPCTKDVCSNSKCIHEIQSNCCATDKDCDDSLACTTDKCDNTKCINELLSCPKSQDPCTIGKCVEPTGCSYNTDYNCANKKIDESKTLTKKDGFFTNLWKWITGQNK